MPEIIVPIVTMSYTVDNTSGVNSGWTSGNSSWRVGYQGSTNVQETYIQIGPVNIPKGGSLQAGQVNRLRKYVSSGQTNPTTLTVASENAKSPAFPASAADAKARAWGTTYANDVTYATSVADTPYDLKLIEAINAVLARSDWEYGDYINLKISSTGQAGPTVNRVYYIGRSGTASLRPSVTLNFTQPAAVVGTLDGALVPVKGGPLLGELGTPQPITGTMSGPLTPVKAYLTGGRPDPTHHTLQAVRRHSPDNHFIVTASGTVHGFYTDFDPTLGSARDEMGGESNVSWFPVSSDPSREAGSLQISAQFLLRRTPKVDAERLKRAVLEARELILPDGSILPLDGGSHRGQSRPDTLDITLYPRSAYYYHPLLGLGTVRGAFPTDGSTPELPIVLMDAGGSIRKSYAPGTVPEGRLGILLKMRSAGTWGLASAGAPMNVDGYSDGSGAFLGYRNRAFIAGAGGAYANIAESQIGAFGDEIGLLLSWDAKSAELYTLSDMGFRTFDIGEPGALGKLLDPYLTAGYRTGGIGADAYLAPGAPALDFPFFLPKRVADRQEAEVALSRMRQSFADPALSFNVSPPEMSLRVEKDDDKPLEIVAGGGAVTFRIRVSRVGGYEGEFITSLIAPEGVTRSLTFVAKEGTDDLYDLTVSAPANYADGTYPISASFKATTADVAGSFYKNVRGAFADLLLISAAFPEIAANPTVVLLAWDTEVLNRPSEILKDSSGNSNAFSWGGNARQGVRADSFLSTGKFASNIFSGSLTSGSIPHRLASSQHYCLLLTEVSKAPTDGVLFQAAAAAGADGVQIVKGTGANTVRLRSVLGGSTVTSAAELTVPDTIAKLALGVDTVSNTIFLYNRDSGLTISIARPTFTDSAMRLTFGAIRSSGGALTNLARTHVLGFTAHPYLMSDITRRRNVDKLLEYTRRTSAFNDKYKNAEYPDGLYALFEFNDGDRFVNRAAPGLTQPVSSSGTISQFNRPTDARAGESGIGTDGSSGSGWLVETVIPSSEIVTVLTNVQNMVGGSYYNTAIGFSDSSTGLAQNMIARHENNGVFVMSRNNNGDHTYALLGVTATSGIQPFKLRLSGAGKTLTAYGAGKSKAVSGNSTWAGTVRVNIGGSKSGTRSFDRNSPSRNNGFAVIRGETTSQEETDTFALLNRAL